MNDNVLVGNQLPTLPLAFQAAYGLCKGFGKRRASVNVSDAFGFAPYRGACELAALCALSNKHTLFPEKKDAPFGWT